MLTAECRGHATAARTLDNIPLEQRRRLDKAAFMKRVLSLSRRSGNWCRRNGHRNVAIAEVDKRSKYERQNYGCSERVADPVTESNSVSDEIDYKTIAAAINTGSSQRYVGGKNIMTL